MTHLTAVWERDYSFDQSDHYQKVRCVAAPVRDLNDHLANASSVLGLDRGIHLSADDTVLWRRREEEWPAG